MGKNPSTKTTSNSSFTSNFDWKGAPINAQTQGVIDMSNKDVGTDPATIGRWAGMEEEVRRSGDDPFGAATSPDVRAKSQLSRILSIRRDRDQAMRSDYHQGQDTMFARKTAAAALTMPQLVQTGGSSQGTQNTTQNPGWGQTVGTIAGAAIGAF